MKKPINVLIFPAGMENGLEIRKALQYCKEVRLFGASSPGINHAFYVFRDVSLVRDVRATDWISDLNKVIRKKQIDVVYPANSTVIDQISAARDQIDAQVLLPRHDIITLTRSKRATIEKLRDVIPVPAVYQSAQDIPRFPVFVKPDQGYGSQGAELIENEQQVRNVNFETHIVQEYLPGKEYSVDCFCDENGSLLFSGARERLRVRMGTSMHAEPVSATLEIHLRDYAERILRRIPISGAWFFQVKMDLKGTLRLLEIDIRIAGTMGFNRSRGINFPLLSILQARGVRVRTMAIQVPLSMDRCLHNRYRLEFEYDTVFVDLDDTLVVHDRLNLELITFLYQCINKGKRVVLISKHQGPDIRVYLRQWRIETLFDEIIWLQESDSKADRIAKARAIFIDDSFSQRAEVAERCGIPTFDPSMIEALIDDRI